LVYTLNSILLGLYINQVKLTCKPSEIFIKLSKSSTIINRLTKLRRRHKPTLCSGGIEYA